MSPSAQSQNTKCLAQRRLFPLESGCDLSLSQGGKGEFFLHPEKTDVWQPFLKKMLCTLTLPAPMFPTVSTNEGIKFEAHYKYRAFSVEYCGLICVSECIT